MMGRWGERDAWRGFLVLAPVRWAAGVKRVGPGLARYNGLRGL